MNHEQMEKVLERTLALKEKIEARNTKKAMRGCPKGGRERLDPAIFEEYIKRLEAANGTKSVRDIAKEVYKDGRMMCSDTALYKYVDSHPEFATRFEAIRAKLGLKSFRFRAPYVQGKLIFTSTKDSLKVPLEEMAASHMINGGETELQRYLRERQEEEIANSQRKEKERTQFFATTKEHKLQSLVDVADDIAEKTEEVSGIPAGMEEVPPNAVGDMYKELGVQIIPGTPDTELPKRKAKGLKVKLVEFDHESQLVTIHVAEGDESGEYQYPAISELGLSFKDAVSQFCLMQAERKIQRFLGR